MIEAPSTVSPHVLSARIEKLQAWGRQQGLDAIIVFGLGSALGTATRSHGNLRYLLDWDGDAAPSAAVVPMEGRPSLVVANIFGAMRAQEHELLAGARFAKGPAFARAVLDLLPKNAKRVSIAGRDEMPVSIWENLRSEAMSGWQDCDAELSRRRAIKDDGQLTYHRKAAAVCDGIFERLGPALHSGAPVFRIQAELEQFGRELGCEHCKTWLTVSPVADRCRYLATENTNVPREGDQALLGIMLTFQGHWGHAIRTGSIGRPSSAAVKTFELVRGMYDAMIDRLRPGADLRLAGQAGIVTADNLGPHFQFRAGHALGYSYEDPTGTAEFPQPYDLTAKLPEQPRLAEPGMLFEVHPNLFIEGFAGASIGDMVLVTEQGPEILTRFERDLLQF
jgi:Xaa-Pro dipeptidase